MTNAKTPSKAARKKAAKEAFKAKTKARAKAAKAAGARKPPGLAWFPNWVLKIGNTISVAVGIKLVHKAKPKGMPPGGGRWILGKAPPGLK